MKKIILLLLNITLFTQISISQSLDLELEKTIQSPEFGYLYGLTVDNEQNIYISDVLAGNIKQFSSKGEFITTIGRQGKGPGEFMVPKNISINKDLLHVFDDQLLRLTSFEIGDSTELKSTMSINKNGNSVPDQVLTTNNGKKYSIATPAYTKENLDQKKEVKVSLLDENGAIVKQSFLKTSAQEYVAIKNGDEFAVGVMPFGNKPLFEVGGDNTLYYAYNNKMKLFKYTSDGELVNEFSYEVDEKVPLKDEDWKKELERLRYDSNALYDLKEKADKKYLPIFDWFVVDNKNRMWIAVNTKDRENYRLLILDQEGNNISSTALPRSTELKVIRDNYAFGIKKAEDNTHSVVRYKIQEL